MVEIEIDGKKVEVAEGSLVMDAARAAGTYIPHFCYHRKLSIAANCRMCLVEVEKAPKPLPACATPVAAGMKVHTHSEKAVQAQKSVMEFLLINHPLDCPICDQGGECQLQDLAVGYGKSGSRYQEEKRVVFHKPMGPLISAEEMARCIHCTRCVRFGQEVGGVMELGMIGRGEHSEITTFLGKGVDSEISGNMIDLCPVGALTSKPFRYAARTWELTRHKSIAPHDSLGSHLNIQTKQGRVKRVVPRENEAINECWLSDRDRFSYEGLNSDERLAAPMVKQGGVWQEVDWNTALEYVANGLRAVIRDHGKEAVGALASPQSTLEELHLLQKVVRGLGSDNIDFRLRQNDFSAPVKGAHWLGRKIASVNELQATLFIGATLRKEQPLLTARLRNATKRGCQVNVIHAADDDLLMPVTGKMISAPSQWVNQLMQVVVAIAQAKQVQIPAEVAAIQGENISDEARKIAQSLLGASSTNGSSSSKAVWLGNLAVAHPQFAQLHTLAQWVADQVDATLGFWGTAANTTGAYLAGVVPQANGLNARAMLEQPRQAYVLLHTEPEWDSVNPQLVRQAFQKAATVIMLSPFKSASAMEYADVMLPIAPFTETAGTFINCEGLAQSFTGVAHGWEQSRPAWKILRVLGNLLDLPNFDYEDAETIRDEVLTRHLKGDVEAHLSNRVEAHAVKLSVTVKTSSAASQASNDAQHQVERLAEIPMYRTDALVRRASALQLTADAKQSLRARLPQSLFVKLALKEGDAIRVAQGEHSVVLPAMLDKSLPDDVVRVAAATPAAYELGAAFGTLTISRAAVVSGA